MRIAAVIFDIYQTLLEVTASPPDAALGWERLWRDTLATLPRLSQEAFARQCDQVIAREHAAARGRGIAFPEIYWPAVAAEVLPELATLSEASREEFLYRQAGLWHQVALMPGAAAALRGLQSRGLLLGLASNAQPYTRRELETALSTEGLSPALFPPDLCFWSFELGFSKPDPHVFRLLTLRLQARGVEPAQILMVGDRVDNDIEPARAQGWQAWHLSRQSGHDWPDLREWLDAGREEKP